jgi:hypothetical protein
MEFIKTKIDFKEEFEEIESSFEPNEMKEPLVTHCIII